MMHPNGHIISRILKWGARYYRNWDTGQNVAKHPLKPLESIRVEGHDPGLFRPLFMPLVLGVIAFFASFSTSTFLPEYVTLRQPIFPPKHPYWKALRHRANILQSWQSHRWCHWLKYFRKLPNSNLETQHFCFLLNKEILLLISLGEASFKPSSIKRSIICLLAELLGQKQGKVGGLGAVFSGLRFLRGLRHNGHNK